MPVYDYQKRGRYFAQIPPGLEDLGRIELAELGAREIKPGYGGLYFQGDLETLYAVNYQSRLLTTVLAPLSTFEAFKPEYLYRRAAQIQWDDFLHADLTFAVTGNVSNSKIQHSHYAALKVKDAIVDFFKNTHGQRPNVDTREPDVRFNLYIEQNRVTLSLDTSGGSLHRRGYRAGAVEAPLRETLAAAIIRVSGWNGKTPLYDPMCGSGTFLCEALMAAAQIPAGWLRKSWGFFRLPDYSAPAWAIVKERADTQMRDIPAGIIGGSDIGKKAVRLTQKALSRLPYYEKVSIGQRDYQDILSLENRTIILNPPYGIRLGAKDDMSAFYKSLGDFLKQRCQGSRAFIYFGAREYLKSIGLRTSMKMALKNGDLDGRLARFEMY